MENIEDFLQKGPKWLEDLSENLNSNSISTTREVSFKEGLNISNTAMIPSNNYKF